MGGGRVVGLLLVAATLTVAVACTSSDDSAGSDRDDEGTVDGGLTVDPVGRFGIPADETPPGLQLCAVEGPSTSAGGAQAALYGEVDREDPYAGPMLGVLWGPADEVDLAGDGESAPVTVRGTAGVVAPITVFQQTVLPELGTVVAWREAGLSVGLYGRLWSPDRSDDLVALADALTFADGLFQLPHDALPAGYGLVYLGSAASMSLLLPLETDYRVLYRTGEGEGTGVVSVYGLAGTVEEFEAFRFLALDLSEADVHGVEMLTGNAWGDSGPAVATWREPDGRILRIVGTGVDLPVITELAQFTRQLTPDEWSDLEAAVTPCSD